jgi:hypothetical protein
MDGYNDDYGAPTRCLYVLSDVDGYKYKLVLQGEVHELPVRRIKKYLRKAAGIEPAQQLLTFNGVALQDSWNGDEAGLFDGAILRLQQMPPVGGGQQHHHGGHPNGKYISHGMTAYVNNSCPVSHRSHVSAESFAPRQQANKWSSLPVQQCHLNGADAGQAAASPPLQSSSPAPRGNLAKMRGRSAGLDPRSHPKRSLSAPLPRTVYSPPSATPPEYASVALRRRPERSPDTSALDVNRDSVRGVGHALHGDTPSESRDLEARVAALSIENVRLREQLQIVARQAADAHADWRQEEEIAQLKAALAAAKSGVAAAEHAAAQRWRVQEEELVRELDLLREERRRVQEDAAGQETKLQDLLHSMEGEIRSLQYELHDKDEALQSARLSLMDVTAQLHEQKAVSCPPVDKPLLRSQQSAGPLTDSIDCLTEQALSHLSYFLATPAPLQLDASNDTCVITISSTLNMLITLDRETEHLYLYIVLLDELPTSPVLRMRVYEMLLQGALLGKDMAGGGVGLSMESSLLLMSTSADLRHNGALALATAAPSFVESAIMWVGKIKDLLRE